MNKLKKLSTGDFLKLLFAFFSLAFFVAALLMPDRDTMFDGLRRIATQTCKISTNNFERGGYAGAFLNAGSVCLICTALYCLPKAKANPASVIAFLLTAGFAFWGINIVNIWFGFLGVLLYCLVKRVSPASQVNAMIFTSGLAPLISELLLRYPNAEAVGFHWQGFVLAVGVGVVVGFFLPAVLAHSPALHKGYDIYSAAVPIGMTAFFLQAILYKVMNVPLPAAPDAQTLQVASWTACNVFCFAVFGLCIVLALLMGCKPRDYWELMKHSGHGADYCGAFGNAAFLMNVGVFGLFIVLYYNLIGATFNAVTFGCIFCMLATCDSGSHPGNVWPIMVGYVAASFLCKWVCVELIGSEYAQAINAQAIVIGLCFANGLSPIAGKYGWPFGILAGALHFCLVTSVPMLHGGFCLYNGGFTAAFVCVVLVPVLEHFFRTKENRRRPKNEISA